MRSAGLNTADDTATITGMPQHDRVGIIMTKQDVVV